MQHTLELLAPARNLSIGIAAIDCGADAVYIAGPAFGARQAAGNSVEDIRDLCTYAHRFGARIYVTVNTILYEEELAEAGKLVRELAAAGTDALIVQDFALLDLCRELSLPLHGSTQCSIRTPERAAFLEGLGFSRVVPERQLSLDEIRAIRGAIKGEIECFVHGALCVCYSGECYLSEYLTGRSANRGACAQACRSRYDLVDGKGKVLVRDKALLSLRDFQLIHRLEDLAEAGACSFKIEGRLKNISYVRNVVRAYSQALDDLVARQPGKYRRASFGRVTEAFTPDLDKTFQRGYTELYLDGRRERGWSGLKMTKSVGEAVGRILGGRADGRGGMELSVGLRPGITLENGDGFTTDSGIGFRGDVCQRERGNVWTVRTHGTEQTVTGGQLFRNLSMAFEREMERRPGRRLLDAALDLDFQPERLHVIARSEDGRVAEADFPTADCPPARDRERMLGIIEGQLSKTSGDFHFSVNLDENAPLPMLKAAFLNEIRRSMAAALDAEPCHMLPIRQGKASDVTAPDTVLYKQNVANSLSRDVYLSHGAGDIGEAYELTHEKGAELMRSRYCIRFELGLCPKYQGAAETGPLYLVNNGRRLALGFDCRNCEMTVREDPTP